MTVEQTGMDAIEQARARASEGIASDERLIGLLPDDLSEQLLRWTLERFQAHASGATSVEEIERAMGEARSAARTLGEAAADAGDDANALRARLDAASADTVAVAPQTPEAVTPEGVSGDAPPAPASLDHGADSATPAARRVSRRRGSTDMRKVVRRLRRWFR